LAPESRPPVPTPDNASALPAAALAYAARGWPVVPARRLKGLGPAALRGVVADWHRRALPAITTKAFETTWADIQTAYLAVRSPQGTAVRAAYEAAVASPLPPIDDNPAPGVLAALCANLSAGKPAFFLGVDTVAELFGVSAAAGTRWLQALQFFGLLRLVTRGTGAVTGGTARASAYEFVTPEQEGATP
jgi:hypothetical protein